MGIKDILKNSFLEQNAINYSLTPLRVILAFLVTFLLTLFIIYIYKKTYKGVLYTKSYSMAIIMVSLVTCLIILPISSNLTLSLGMVGALSIVRFRTAIKDPMDIGFMFWAIAVGLTNGAGFYIISIIGSAIIGASQYYITKYEHKGTQPYLIVIRYKNGLDFSIAKELLPQYKIKSHTYSKETSEFTAEIEKFPEEKSLKKLRNIEEIIDVVIVEYNGDYVS